MRHLYTGATCVGCGRLLTRGDSWTTSPNHCAICREKITKEEMWFLFVRPELEAQAQARLEREMCPWHEDARAEIAAFNAVNNPKP